MFTRYCQPHKHPPVFLAQAVPALIAPLRIFGTAFYLILWVAASVLFPSQQAVAGPAGLDPTFGNGGVVTTNLGDQEGGRGIALQSDGKILLSGSAFNGTNYDIAVCRYNTNGTLDTSFNASGSVTTDLGGDDIGWSVVVQTDGKILIAGTASGAFAVIRYNPSGSLDTSFNGVGYATSNAGGGEHVSLALQNDGKIVVGGTTYFGFFASDIAILRYNSNGSLDTSFGSNGIVTSNIDFVDLCRSVLVQPDGKILAAGESRSSPSQPSGCFALVRYNGDGTLDASFGNGGTVDCSGGNSGYDLALQADGKILLAGIVNRVGDAAPSFAIARYNPSGTLDASFGTGGSASTEIESLDQANGLALQSDGKIVLAGYSNNFENNDPKNDFSVVRYNADGSLDTTFNGTGKLITAIGNGEGYGYDVVLQSDGKILVAGEANATDSYLPNGDFAIVRYEGNIPSPTPTPTPTPTPSPTPTTISTLSGLLNISTRLSVGTGENVGIGGFIITGISPKKVILRAIGPSLSAVGVSGVLADPVLELHEPDGSIIKNDDWKQTQQSDIEATGIAPHNDKESAIVETLNPGAYTAIVTGKNGTAGIALVEVYDLDPATDSTLANISTRGYVDTGDNVMIGGLIIGNGSADVVVRGMGPSLQSAGVGNPLSDPTLELHDANGLLINLNDNWKNTQESEIEGMGNLAPTNDLESAIVATLPAGAYTAIVRGNGSTTGVGLVEAYDITSAGLRELSLITDEVTDPTIPLGTVIFASDGELSIWQKVTKDSAGTVLGDAGVVASDTATQFWVDVSTDPATGELSTILFPNGLKLVVLSASDDGKTLQVAVYVNDVQTDVVTITSPGFLAPRGVRMASPAESTWFTVLHSGLDNLNKAAVFLSAVRDVVGSAAATVTEQALNSLGRGGGVFELASNVAIKITDGTAAAIPVREIALSGSFATTAIAIATASVVGGPLAVGAATLAAGNLVLDLGELLQLKASEIDTDNNALALLAAAQGHFPKGDCFDVTSSGDSNCCYTLTVTSDSAFFSALGGSDADLSAAAILTEDSSNTDLRQQIFDAVQADVSSLQSKLTEAAGEMQAEAALITTLEESISFWQGEDPNDIVDDCGISVSEYLGCLEDELQDQLTNQDQISAITDALNSQIAAFQSILFP